MHSQPNHQQHQAQQVSLTAAQQQHYNRLANSHNNAATNMAVSAAAHVQDSGLENVSEDNRRTLSYIADLLSENTREAALLELSKKREQVPELALILWHSFGTCLSFLEAWHLKRIASLTLKSIYRCYDLPDAGDYLCL